MSALRIASLLEGAPAGLRGPWKALEGLEELLDQQLAQIRAAHPTLPLDEPRFLRHLGGRLPNPAALQTLRGPDVFLAFACEHGLPGAIDAFDQTVLLPLSRALERLCGPNLDEVRQQLRLKLFVGSAPAIAQYQGRGALKEWVRASAARIAINLYRDAQVLPAANASLLDRMPLEGANLELGVIRKQFQEKFAEAFAHALGLLTPRERTLLRMHLLDGLSLDEIGAFYRVDRSTASRWVVKARREVLKATRRYLANVLSMTPSEMTSVFRGLRSQMDLQISGFLAD